MWPMPATDRGQPHARGGTTGGLDPGQRRVRRFAAPISAGELGADRHHQSQPTRSFATTTSSNQTLRGSPPGNCR